MTVAISDYKSRLLKFGLLPLMCVLDFYDIMFFGPDGISARVLKEMHSSIALILKVIFDCCLSTGVVPNDWKIANVTPLFKKSDRLQTSNYRPISLTTVVLYQKFLNISYALTL